MFRVLLAAHGTTSRVRKQAEAIARLPHAAESVEAYVLYVFEESAIDDDSELVNPRWINAVTEAEEYLTEQGIDVEVLGRAGNTVARILDVAEEYEVAGLYVGGPARSPTGKAVFGSVTQDVILQSDLPVTVTIDE
jgi:nucleotide-binding universal stress UspA family protein